MTDESELREPTKFAWGEPRHERLLQYGDAIKVVQSRRPGMSYGAADFELRRALDSMRVRLWIPKITDGGARIFGVKRINHHHFLVLLDRHGAFRAEVRRQDIWISEEDLRDWLNQNMPATIAAAPPVKAIDPVSQISDFPKTAAKTYRYAGDAALVERGRRMIFAGMTKSEAARRLALETKEGGTPGQRANRLRRLF